MGNMTYSIAAHNSLKKRVFKSFVWLAGTRYIGQMISWIITIFVARILSPKDYGIMGMATLFYSFLILFIEMGLGAAIIQKKESTKKQLSSAFWFITLSGLFLFLLSFFSAPIVGLFFKEPNIIPIVRVMAVNFIIISLYSIPYNLLAKELALDKTSKAEFVANLSGSITTLFFAWRGFEVWSFVFGFFAVNIVKTALIYYYKSWIPDFRLVFSDLKDILSLGTKISATTFFWYFYSNADFLVAGRMLGSVALGYYSLAFIIASLPLDKIASLINQVAFPAYSEMQEDIATLQRYYLKIVQVAFFVVTPIFIGIFIVSEDAVKLFLTDKWITAVFPLQVLSIISILRTLSALNPPLLTALNKQDITLFNTFLCAVVMPISFVIGCKYGIKGLSYAWLIAYSVVFIFMFWNSNRIIKVSLSDYFRQLRPTVLSSFGMLIIVECLKATLFTHLSLAHRVFFSCLAGVLVFSSLIYILNKKMLREILSYMRDR
jgi:teichuronic acid exporter